MTAAEIDPLLRIGGTLGAMLGVAFLLFKMQQVFLASATAEIESLRKELRGVKRDQARCEREKLHQGWIIEELRRQIFHTEFPPLPPFTFPPYDADDEDSEDEGDPES